MPHKIALFLLFLALPFNSQAKLPVITPAQTHAKLDEIMKMHATYKEISPLIVKRALQNYLEELDPTKSYFIEPDIHQWLEPTEETTKKVLDNYRNNNFQIFADIQNAMGKAIKRRRGIEQKINLLDLPKKVSPDEFKNMKWTQSENELTERITRIKALQMEAAEKLNDEFKEKSLQRIAKRQQKQEEDFLNSDPRFREEFILSNVLKAFASSLDSHTAYFTPDEATQFMMQVQQRLFGIGAQLRDDINGFTVVKLIEGSPAAASKLKPKDKIIAVNGEPVVGMDIIDVVELIRGEEGTFVVLTVIRQEGEGENKKEEKLAITVPRGQVVLKETRYEATLEPFGNGVIAYLRLYSFYQDQSTSSADDLIKALQKIKKEHLVTGVLLDLRYNAGGLLSQAVDVAGMFLGKGIVASIKDETGQIQHLRVLDSKVEWEGPLVVLINRASASASEIVAQALQDYGRAIIVGDDHSYGKGSFQTFTLNTTKSGSVNPQGEYKVTRGIYYTVSGKTPQLTGVLSEIIIPSALSEMEIGEQYSKYPLENNRIKENFDDDLSDVSFLQREKVRALYKFDLQKKLHTLDPFRNPLKQNSEERIANNKTYQTFLKEIKKKDKTIDEEEETGKSSQTDLQLNEAYNVLKDLIYWQHIEKG